MLEEKIVEYILVNKELNMSVGKITGQVAHAQTLIDREVYENLQLSDRIEGWYGGWFQDHSQTKIILRAKEKELIKAIELGGIPVRDNGLTEIPKGSLTVVGFFPQPKSNLTKFTKRMQLL